jgi:hypothetical protein
MNNAQKPAVIAKKRGRPAGVKNKSVAYVPAKIDWEKLAKQLQVALASQIKDNDILEAELSRKRTLWERLVCLGTGTV